MLEQTKENAHGYNTTKSTFCLERSTEESVLMEVNGKKRNCLKYRYPSIHYGLECKGKSLCDLGKAIRIPLDENRRIFTPLASSSYKWKKTYSM